MILIFIHYLAEHVLQSPLCWAIRYTPETPTKTYIMRSNAGKEPKRAVTKLKLKSPTNPQFNAPTLTSRNVTICKPFMISHLSFKKNFDNGI